MFVADILPFFWVKRPGSNSVAWIVRFPTCVGWCWLNSSVFFGIKNHGVKYLIREKYTTKRSEINGKTKSQTLSSSRKCWVFHGFPNFFYMFSLGKSPPASLSETFRWELGSQELAKRLDQVEMGINQNEVLTRQDIQRKKRKGLWRYLNGRDR